MSSPQEDIAIKLLRVLQNKEYDAWDDIVAEDIVVYFPFAPEGMPNRFEGRDNFRDAGKHFFDQTKNYLYYDLETILTQDPEFVIITGKSKADLQSGKVYENQYVFFFRVRDGKVVEYWEHFNPLNVMKAFFEE